MSPIEFMIDPASQRLRVCSALVQVTCYRHSAASGHHVHTLCRVARNPVCAHLTSLTLQIVTHGGEGRQSVTLLFHRFLQHEQYHATNSALHFKRSEPAAIPFDGLASEYCASMALGTEVSSVTNIAQL